MNELAPQRLIYSAGSVMKMHPSASGLFILAAIVAALASSKAGERDVSAAVPAAITESVRSFMLDVARDITQHGPTAWQRWFSANPAFFMVVNGQMAFADGAAAIQGIAALPTTIKRIELTWGDDLRVDPLTNRLAVVASSYRELQTRPDDTQFTDHGYFTAVAERRHGRWVFRDAHWSSAAKN